MGGACALNLNNKYFIRGLLLILSGIVFMLWSFDVININFSVVFNTLIAIILIFYGERYSRFSETRSFGNGMIIFGIFFVAYTFLVHVIGISLKFIIAVALLVYGFYFVFIRSKVFMFNKGVFKDSRNDIDISERFSAIHINNFSDDISSVKIKTFFSDIAVNFLSTRMITKDTIDFEILGIFGDIRISINPSWNVILNGNYIRRNGTASKTVSIRSKSLFCNINVV